MHTLNPMHVLKVILIMLVMMSLSIRETVAEAALIVSNEEAEAMDLNTRAELLLNHILANRLPGQSTAYYCKNKIEYIVFVPDEVDKIVLDAMKHYDSTVDTIAKEISELCSGGL